MSGSHATILPAAVSPADAAKILAAVNGAATAQALAAAIELPNEPDIGLALAGPAPRSARAQLGGTFTTLDQIARGAGDRAGALHADRPCGPRRRRGADHAGVRRPRRTRRRCSRS